MKMHAFSFDHPEQRIELASIRDSFRIQNQGLSVTMPVPSNTDGWTLKQVQGDAA
ncbi:hypothetical protein [Novosphingobium sp.]|uniref:hypothetical protein n=1 Tax=Novosphingobium sp. TaxID=1874826 RepID=UPI002736A824|nr:hypothetical protein [Novosphingobium sp.]MDP3905803.1 hypothetical protein [Novosphingobium sp.]